MKISLCLHIEKNAHTDSYQQAYNEFITLCKMADRASFHTLWTGEHHGMDFAITPNPLLSLADLAHQTQSIRLGTATLIAPFWHPIRLAGEIAYTDMISHGRLEVGFSKGAFHYEYDRLKPGMNNDDAGEMMRESIQALQKLWQGNYSHQGKHWQFPETSISPQPSQLPYPPLWVAAQSPYTIDFAIEHGCNVQMTPLWFGEDKVQECINTYQHAVQKHQADHTKMLLLRHAFIVNSEEEKARILAQFSTFYAEFAAWFNQSNPVSNGNLVGDIEIGEMFTVETLAQNLLIGTAQEVLAQLKQYEAQGVDEFALWIANGMSFETKKAFLEQFIEHVLPHFQSNE
ncbi:LLM class flavin-dependent oxidoreductase [Photobacterium damselae subsp. damselae]|uniref:LLM class flavin-dependent oxidoreductase n=1 Tax=Photobacterium damselae TaxID=38293 RepID=UPI000D0493AA|nr:LLM class flavin-dependent oxidoreductase [Photobacterium damselae]PSB89854.1 LLM class flavin-dependent oxidoreductase [Photobacterium damselae subsp. damselae]